MKTNTIIPILAALLLATACTKTIEFSGKETESMPVLISQPESDSTLNVRLTYSRFFLDDSPFKIINNASFRAELNGSTISPNFTYMDQGLYNSDLTLHENDTLTLHVIVPDKGEITAGCRMPYRPQITDLTFTPDTTIENYDDYQHPEITYVDVNGSVNFRFQLHDPDGQSNYYMLRAYCLNNITRTKDYLYLKVDDNVLFDGSSTDDYLDLDITEDYSQGTQVLFTDDRINGLTHTISGIIGSIHYELNKATLYFEITSLSRDTYLYTITRQSQQNSNDILGFLSEPVRIHTNVQGGIGILGAKATIHQYIDLSIADTTTHQK